jgi:hypothetical protein
MAAKMQDNKAFKWLQKLEVYPPNTFIEGKSIEWKVGTGLEVHHLP